MSQFIRNSKAELDLANNKSTNRRNENEQRQYNFGLGE